MRLLTIMLISILTYGSALADMHDNFDQLPTPDYDESLSAEIQEFLDIYAKVYNEQDYDTLLGMWDQDYPHPIYMAEEVNPPMHGWQRLRAYFNPKPGFTVLDGIRNTYTDVRANYLTPDLAIATYTLHFDIKVKRQKALSSWDRIMAVFRKKDGQWKLTAYAEAPMSPLTMVRKMLQGQVPEDFPDYIKTQKERSAR